MPLQRIKRPTSLSRWRAQSATFVPKWNATTAHLAGDKVLNPTGDVVSAKVGFTSGASYSAASWDLSPTYPAKGGKSKTDGQNFKNLRRPTLVLDRMFPTLRADHEIVYVDEAAKVAYSVGRDRRFRKSTWTSITDVAATWGGSKATSQTTSYGLRRACS
jgi:hypothetical protein